MIYIINYSPVFNSKSGKLKGYEMYLSLDPEETRATFNSLTVQEGSDDEFDRFSGMLGRIMCPWDKVSFTEQSPIEIINHLRGISKKVRRTIDWQNEVPDWKLNVRGERV